MIEILLPLLSLTVSIAVYIYCRSARKEAERSFERIIKLKQKMEGTE